MSIGIIGLLIWIMGVLGTSDLLGFGLMGTSGLIKYLLGVAAVAAVFFGLYVSIRRGVLWAQPIQRIILRLPKIGRCLQTLALSLAWALHLTLESGMDLKPAFAFGDRNRPERAFHLEERRDLASHSRRPRNSRSARGHRRVSPRFWTQSRWAKTAVELVESMRSLSKQYQEEAKAAMAMLTVLGGLLVGCIVAGLIITLIFRLSFTVYLNPINDMLKEAS